MNVFEFLTEEAYSVVKRFNAVVEHYPATSDWTWDRAFAETKKDITMLTEHLKKETVVENNVRQSKDLTVEMDKAASQRKEINSSIDNVLMIHVDEAGFKEGLQQIAERLDEHTNFCVKSYYPLLQEKLSADELQNIQDQLEFSLHG